METVASLIRALAVGICLVVSTTLSADNWIIIGDATENPKIYLEEETPKGVLIDILDYVQRETGDSYQYLLYPWARAYLMAERGTGAIVGFSKNEERLQRYDYSEVIYNEDILLVVMKGNEFSYTGIESLYGKRVGAVRDGSYGDQFDLARQQRKFTLIEDNNATHRLKLLFYGRSDIALIGSGAAGLMNSLREDPQLWQNRHLFVPLDRPFRRDPNYLGVLKGSYDPALLERFNKALRRGYEGGDIPAIIERHAGQP
ncbi:substrate-binding periplasmic protein [Aestuariirhabdus sp. LZHN29]|uniref:substrate-binding periplasmic protein n=1 Tax=Aestuariirhabdus sp. LZHN29 TaxID=3417462 RepID=UPI003CF81472